MTKKELMELFGLKSEKELQALFLISVQFTPEQLEKLAEKIPANKNLILTYLI